MSKLRIDPKHVVILQDKKLDGGDNRWLIRCAKTGYHVHCLRFHSRKSAEQWLKTEISGFVGGFSADSD
jgi:hypothetical protein